jgi:hypothetical protein
MKTTPIPTFPLKGKESKEKAPPTTERVPLPLRGRDRVGVVQKFSVISVFSVADLVFAFEDPVWQ